METTNSPRRLYKSRQNRIIDGVCGGIAEYFEVDPTIVRLLWVLITLLGGSGIILYILAMIIMPANPNQVAGVQASPVPSTGTSDRKRFFGVMMILVGAFLLLLNLGWISGFPWWGFSGRIMLPVLLILLGGLFIYVQSTRRPDRTVPTTTGMAGEVPPQPVPPRELRRSPTDKKLFGVCSGLAKYFNIDPTIVRILFVFLVLASFGWGLLLYIILGIVMPEEKPTTVTPS